MHLDDYVTITWKWIGSTQLPIATRSEYDHIAEPDVIEVQVSEKTRIHLLPRLLQRGKLSQPNEAPPQGGITRGDF